MMLLCEKSLNTSGLLYKEWSTWHTFYSVITGNIAGRNRQTESERARGRKSQTQRDRQTPRELESEQGGRQTLRETEIGRESDKETDKS